MAGWEILRYGIIPDFQEFRQAQIRGVIHNFSIDADRS